MEMIRVEPLSKTFDTRREEVHAVAILVVLMQIFQAVGNLLSKKLDRRRA